MSFRNLTTGFALIALSVINLFGQGLDVRAVPQNRSGPNGVLLYVADKVKSTEINSALNDRSLVGYNPLVVGFNATPDNLDEVTRELSWRQNDAWAFYCMGQKIASGSSAPSIDKLQNAFLTANIPNRVVVLRNFLARNPTNLDALRELMKVLHRYAYQKTLNALNIIPRKSTDDPYLLWGSTVAPERKDELSPEDDQNIWGELAALITATFAADDWLSILPDYFRVGYPENAAFHSPTMKAIYKRNLSRVEREVEKRQTDIPLWAMWEKMAQTAGRRMMDFYQQFADLPDPYTLTWPPSSVERNIVNEARLLNDWTTIVQVEWPGWQSLQTTLNRFAPVGRMPNVTDDTSDSRDRLWKHSVFPLLEACLNAKDFDKANEIYFDISVRPVFEREARLAVEMANSHKYKFPMPPYDYKVPESHRESFIGDPVVGDRVRFKSQPNKLKDIVLKGYYTNLLIVDPSKTGDTNQLNDQIRSVLTQGKLPEYYIFPRVMKPTEDLAVELIKQEGFSDNTFIWGILDDDVKYHHGGHSLPTLDGIMELLDSMRKKPRTVVLREYAREHQESITAKVLLLADLGRIGNIRATNAKMGDDGFLDESVDMEIWGEYVNVADSVIPQLILHSYAEIDLCFRPPFIKKNSRQLQSLAMRHIERIESALQARPHSKELWSLWGMFSPYVPNRSLAPFLASLTPVPGLDNFPTVDLYPEIIRNHRSVAAWAQIIDLVEPVWEQYQKIADSGEDIKHMLSRSVWEQYIAPLCEAYEKLGREQKADKIRADWKKAEGWS